MAFNHYAKLARIISELESGWYIIRIDQPTSAKTFSGDVVRYDHYYRIFTSSGEQVPYGKFQKIDKLASVLKTPVEALPVLEAPER